MYRDKYEPDRVARISARNIGTGEVESIPLYAADLPAEELAALRKDSGE